MGSLSESLAAINVSETGTEANLVDHRRRFQLLEYAQLPVQKQQVIQALVYMLVDTSLQRVIRTSTMQV